MIAEAAKEIVNWATKNPGKDFLALAVVLVGGACARIRYKAHKENRAKVDALTASLPKVEPVRLPGSPKSSPSGDRYYVPE